MFAKRTKETGKKFSYLKRGQSHLNIEVSEAQLHTDPVGVGLQQEGGGVGVGGVGRGEVDGLYRPVTHTGGLQDAVAERV